MNKKLKRLLGVILAMTFSFSLIACSNSNTGEKNKKEVKKVEAMSKENKEIKNDTNKEFEDKDAEKKLNKKEKEEKKNNEVNDKQYKLYFADEQCEKLVAEERIIDDATPKKVLEELLKGPKTKNLFPSINTDIKINTVTIKDNVATVDFDESVLGRIAGSTGESLAMYGISNTFILNKQLNVEKVAFTLNNKPMESLGGHVILEGPIGANESLIKK